MSQEDFVIFVVAGAFVGALIGLVVGGFWLAVLFFLAAPFVGRRRFRGRLRA
jgi:tight adherence protein B